MTKQPKSAAERQRAFRARQKARGLIEVPGFGIWLDKPRWYKVRAFARKLAGK